MMDGIIRVGKVFDLEEHGVSESRFRVSLSCGIGFPLTFFKGHQSFCRWKSIH